MKSAVTNRKTRDHTTCRKTFQHFLLAEQDQIIFTEHSNLTLKMSEKRPGSDKIQSEEDKIARLDKEELQMSNSLIGNPGFSQINQHILTYLDHNSQMSFRLVCQSWKTQMEEPHFWIKKLDSKAHNDQKFQREQKIKFTYFLM